MCLCVYEHMCMGACRGGKGGIRSPRTSYTEDINGPLDQYLAKAIPFCRLFIPLLMDFFAV